MNSEARVQITCRVLENLTDGPIEEVIDKELKAYFNGEINLQFKEEIKEELEGFGPIKIHLDDNEVSEILIDSFDKIFVEKGGILKQSPNFFTNDVTLNRFIKRILTLIDRVADLRHPLVDGTLPDGTRVHVALPPITANPAISLRRHQKKAWSLESLVNKEMLTDNQAQKLLECIKNRSNILICGATGCGKTTLLRSLLLKVPTEERIIIVEDTAELSMQKPNTVSLLTRVSLEGLFPPVTLSDLLKNALRMRPDRLVVGEIRNEEALVFLDAVSTGHSGSLSSIHGSSAMQALSRLENLVSRAAPQWSQDAIRKLVYESVDLVVCLGRKNGNRQIHEIADLAGLESFGYLLNPWQP